MHKWTGRTAPQKMSLRWIWVIIALVYYILAYYAICYAAQKSLAGVASSDWPPIALIACLASILYGRRLRGRVNMRRYPK